MQNKRMSRRLQVSIPVSLELDGERHEGMAREIGEGGMRFECAAELKPSMTGLFELNSADDTQPIRVSGEVLYKYPPVGSSGALQYGIRFVDVDAATKESLANFLRVLTLRERYAPRRGAMIIED